MLIKNVARYFSQAKNSGLFVSHMKIFMENSLLISFLIVGLLCFAIFIFFIPRI